MDYNNFKEIISEELKSYFPDTYSIELTTVRKNNDIYKDAVIIRSEGSNVAPTIYLGSFWDAYSEGNVNIGDIVSDIAGIYEKNCMTKVCDIDFFADYERVKDSIHIRLINGEKNADINLMAPCRSFLDLMVVYYYDFRFEGKENASIMVTDAHMKVWGVTEEELFEQAMENSVKDLPPKIKSLSDIIAGVYQDEENSIYINVLTNSAFLYGAACMAYPDVIETFAREKNSNVIVIPSSVHEVLLIPDKNGPDVDSVNELIRSVNDTAVEDIEVLSDHAYYYDRNRRKLGIYGV